MTGPVREAPPDTAPDNRRLPSMVFAYGFSFRKRAIVRRFLGKVRVQFVRRAGRLPSGAALILWGSQPVPPGVAPDIAVIRIEDGFLRSVGLGADLTAPLSWVIDRRGIYYDATRPSDLEGLLQHTEFGADLLARAALLRGRIVANRLTKYNVGAAGWRRPPLASRVILVPGQVESDASLRFGAPGIASNMALLRAVRTANPHAYLVYKPHPDVIAGLRTRGRGEDQARHWCDEIVTDAAMSDLLPLVDEVHVLTSLAGFEALLRDKSVVCYGQPFYAGWGLTTDMAPVARRSRRLSLDALVAGALILYPTYVSRRAPGGFCTAEQTLDELLAWRAEAAGLSWWSKGLRMALRIGGVKR